MSLKRWAAKRDESEPAIVEALLAHGFSVERQENPDLLLGKHGITRPAEVKTGKKPLSKSQREWWGRWKGSGCIVLRTVNDVEMLAKYWSLVNADLARLLAGGTP